MNESYDTIKTKRSGNLIGKGRTFIGRKTFGDNRFMNPHETNRKRFVTIEGGKFSLLECMCPFKKMRHGKAHKTHPSLPAYLALARGALNLKILVNHVN